MIARIGLVGQASPLGGGFQHRQRADPAPPRSATSSAPAKALPHLSSHHHLVPPGCLDARLVQLLAAARAATPRRGGKHRQAGFPANTKGRSRRGPKAAEPGLNSTWLAGVRKHRGSSPAAAPLRLRRRRGERRQAGRIFLLQERDHLLPDLARANRRSHRMSRALASTRSSSAVSLASLTTSLTTSPSHSGEARTISTAFWRTRSIGVR